MHFLGLRLWPCVHGIGIGTQLREGGGKRIGRRREIPSPLFLERLIGNGGEMPGLSFVYHRCAEL